MARKTFGYFPTDILFLASTNPDGICYIETANLDGETNLKIRNALEKTWDYVTPEKVCEFKAMVFSSPFSSAMKAYGLLIWRSFGGVFVLIASAAVVV